MKYRELGRTGWKISEISFGAWAIGGTWGTVDDKESLAALHAALDGGVNFFDTADVYGDGRSERLLAKLKKERKDKFYIATKAGRRLPANGRRLQSPEPHGLCRAQFEESATDAIDLLQLHCRPRRFIICRRCLRHARRPREGRQNAPLRRERGKSRGGVESHRIPRRAIGADHLQYFPPTACGVVLPGGAAQRVGILARVPLASGLLSGKLTRTSTFARDDHRSFNRHGEAFDRGETFSGVDYETGLELVEQLRPLAPAGLTMPQLALRWILEFPAVTCAIPGAKRLGQVQENVAASDQPRLSRAAMKKIQALYDRRVRPLVHHYW
jgi:aryl-alcohol dehydrogenase-like predicted oxidoreductase